MGSLRGRSEHEMNATILPGGRFFVSYRWIYLIYLKYDGDPCRDR